MALVSLGLFATAVGAYGVYSLAQTANIVADTYDRPLMAINFARSASFTFAQMERKRLERQLASPAERPDIDRQLDDMTADFLGDLQVANERAMAESEREVIQQIKTLVDQWGAARQRDAASVDAREDTLGDRIAERFDRLIELVTDHSFLERRKSVATVSRFEFVGIITVVMALLFAQGLTLYLSRRIIRPLTVAAGVANRIAQGELQAPIPQGDADETGMLLNSMTVMQNNIRTMMEREQAQKASAEGRLIDAVESSREAMVLVDSDGRIVLANSQFAQFFPAVARLLAESADFSAIQARIGASLAPVDGRQGSGTDILATGGEGKLADGSWIRVSRSPTRDRGFFLLLTDVTDIKEREERYRVAKVAADAANAAKSNFLANMSHELRTPLNAIIGFSDIFRSQPFGPLGHEKYSVYAKDIHAGGVKLLEIVNAVLEIARSQAGALELGADTLDLRELLDSVARRYGKACEQAGLTFELGMADEPLMMRADERRLVKLIDNLTSNAIKFTGSGGRVVVAVNAAGDRIELAVSDTGIGMSPDQILQALEPFGQVDAKLARRFEGIGLGLSLAKALAELHGGTLRIDSVPDRGTTVTVSFPRLLDPVFNPESLLA